MTDRTTWTKRLLAPAIRRSRAFSRADDGAVAVEFAILAIPFFSIIFAIIETAMAFFAQQVLESAVQDASRYIQTGQAQADGNGWTLAEFRDAMCPKFYGLLECDNDSRLRIIVKVVNNFNSATVTPPINPACTPGGPVADCTWAVSSSYADGVGKNVILIQAYYKWPILLNLPWFNLATQAGDSRLLSAVRVFQNEPF